MEIWKPVQGYEGFYEVSNEGNVRSIAVWSHKYQRVLKRKIPTIKVQDTTIEGYKRVLLSLYGVHKHCAVHRLVAMAFLDNGNNLPEVNHKDENPANNKVDNLEWCTRKYNANYGTLPQRISERCTNDIRISKPVIQLTINGEFVKRYPSIKEASRQTGAPDEVITRVCKGKAKTSGGYIWAYCD